MFLFYYTFCLCEKEGGEVSMAQINEGGQVNRAHTNDNDELII